MKKRAISYSWPATLSFSADNCNENERFSRGKLRVFYKGETADHRYFSDEFAQELVKSLPYTPIVSNYDEEKDDFVGHATEQSIYGIVDPRGSVSFEEDAEGKVWCICDTVLYTERPDKVGEIAKKIAGHSQSLELDPTTVKYTVNYDNKRHFKNIEFTAGHFVGVSVLGSDQKPAFTGSEFFASNELFEERMKLLHDYCEQKGQEDTQSGDNEMNLQEFITLSWGEKAQKVAEAIYSEYEQEYFMYVVDMFDDCAIVNAYSLIDGSIKMLRIHYGIDEQGSVTLGDVNEVHVVYEDLPDVDSKATLSDSGVEQAEEQPVVEDTPVEDEAPVMESVAEPVAEQLSEEDMGAEPSAEDVETSDVVNAEEQEVSEVDAAISSEESAEEAAQVTNATITPSEEVGAVNEQISQENSSSAPLADSERAEFEALKREKKEELLNSYKDYLSEEEFNAHFAALDSVSEEDLEQDLLKSYKAYQEENAKPVRPFSWSYLDQNNEKNENSLSALIAKNLKR